MPLSSAKRAWIAVAALITLAALILVASIYYLHRTPSAQPAISGVPIYPASPQQAQHTFDLISELPGDAPAVGYIDVAALRKMQSSPLTRLLGLAPGTSSPHDRDYQLFVRETGFDYTRDLDRAAVAFWPGAGVSESEPPASDNRAFAIAEGRFDQKKIVAYALKSGKPLTRAGRTIYVLPGTPPVAFEFLGPTRVALTSGSKPQELLLAARGTMALAFRRQLNRVDGAILFAVARTQGLPEAFYASFSSSPQIETLARSIQSLTLAAQPQGNIVKVELEAQTASAQNALAITTLLEISRMAASMALANPQTSSRVTPQQSSFLDALVSQLKLSHQNRSVLIHFDITPAMLGPAETDSRSPARPNTSH